MKVPVTSRAQRYIYVLARWCCITFVVFAIILWTGKYITENVLTRTYEATAEIQVGSERITELPELNPAAPPSPRIQAEFQKMESPEILLPVIQDLGLDKAWAKRIPKSDDEKLSADEALAHLGKMLKLDYTRGTNIIDITVSGVNSIETARLANAIADRYKAKRDAEEDQKTSRAMAALREQIAEQEKVVVEKNAAYERLKHDIFPENLETQLEAVNKDLIAAKNKNEARSRIDELQKKEDELVTKIRSFTGIDPAFYAVRLNLNDAQSQLDTLNAKLMQENEEARHMQSSVQILARAEAPAYPSKPNNALYFMGTVGIAALVSVVVGCFVEVIMLFCRAAEEEKT